MKLENKYLGSVVLRAPLLAAGLTHAIYIDPWLALGLLVAFLAGQYLYTHYVVENTRYGSSSATSSGGPQTENEK